MMWFLTASDAFPGIWDHISDRNALDINIIFQLAANLIRILLWISGVAAVAIFIIAGIMYMTSSGDPARTAKAKSTITNAVIGLVLVMSAYSIITLISGKVG